MKLIKNKTHKQFILFLILFLFLGSIVNAHPGNTAGDGCHYCRTNCDKWGVAWDERHCHGGGEPVQEVQQYYSPPTNTPRPLPTLTPKPTVTPKATNTVVPTLKPTVKQVKKVQKKAFKKKQVVKKPTATLTPNKGFFQSLFGN